MSETPADRASFRRLVATQFLTVFNDNAFKQTVLLLALGAEGLGGDPQARAGLVFALPFLLFAVFAGDLADRIDKRRLVLACKLAEVGVMLLAALALASGSLGFGMLTLFLMGAQSAFLGPAKYGILPELVPPRRLNSANGIFQASVIGGILLGTGCAGFLKQGLGTRLWIAPLVFALLAGWGARIAAGIRPGGAADPARRLRFHPAARLREGFRRMREIPGLRRVVLGHGLFWMVGGTLLFAWNEMGARILRVDAGWWSAGLALLTLAMGLGSLLAGRLSRGRPRPAQILLGGSMMSLGFAAVALGPRDPAFVLAATLLANFFAAFYLVPLNTLLQERPAPADRGRIQGSSQTVDWICIVGASLLKEGLSGLGVDAAWTFLVLALLMGAATLLFLGVGPRLASREPRRRS